MKKYPIAEIFTSPQGEGLFTGTLMTFIRLAGCTVGKVIKEDKPNVSPHAKNTGKYGLLPLWQEECTTWDGRKFLCDTNFRRQFEFTDHELLERVKREGVDHVCLTGGEPLMHDLSPLLAAFTEAEITTHLETSGTVDITKVTKTTWETLADFYDLWVTVSPKLGCLPEMITNADEVKVLVDDSFSFDMLTPEMIKHQLLFLQPINQTSMIDKDNLKRCLAFQLDHPHVRISTQMHKIWSVR